ncbi:hypothetical protein [Maridesulfovibrio sp.]|uniref:hypothetical protein n=1 Tax=Maridesulfovibrio sp. TaxID=2795000 RepID=UPI002A188973|nr:hypothetical protein [Maridesulfovibrio sp.]
MNESFRLEIQGPDAAEAAASIQMAVSEIFGGEPVLSEVVREAENDALKTDVVDYVIIALAIPPALVATIDLINRSKVVDKINRIKNMVGKLEKSLPEFDINFVIGGVAFNLKKAKSEDLASAMAEEQGRKNND